MNDKLKIAKDNVYDEYMYFTAIVFGAQKTKPPKLIDWWDEEEENMFREIPCDSPVGRHCLRIIDKARSLWEACQLPNNMGVPLCQFVKDAMRIDITG